MTKSPLFFIVPTIAFVVLLFAGLFFLAMADNKTTDVEVEKMQKKGYRILGIAALAGIISFILYRIEKFGKIV